MNNNAPELILVVVGLVAMVTMCTATQAREVTPANITLEEYDVLCPEVDFSPMHPICSRVRIRTYCPPPDVDFSPARPPVCIRTICPETDFSPQPEECLDEQDTDNTDFGPHY